MACVYTKQFSRIPKEIISDIIKEIESYYNDSNSDISASAQEVNSRIRLLPSIPKLRNSSDLVNAVIVGLIKTFLTLVEDYGYTDNSVLLKLVKKLNPYCNFDKETIDTAEEIINLNLHIGYSVNGLINKQFSNKPTTEENTNKVIGQIMKTDSGKPLFQIIATTSDMELAGKTKNALLKMGFSDAQDEVKQFGKSSLFYVTKNNDTEFWSFDNDWTQRMDEANAWTSKEDAEKIAKKVNGEVKQFAFGGYKFEDGFYYCGLLNYPNEPEPMVHANGKFYCLTNKGHGLLGDYYDEDQIDISQAKCYKSLSDLVSAMGKDIKQFAKTFGAPQPISINGKKYYILGYNNREYAIQNEQGQNILGDIRTEGVDWNSIVFWLRKQGANTSKAEALHKCVDERIMDKGVIAL